ncbi:ohanin-like [Thamnophis elegans]|uniref:ohanin-like n=1 Tax=Thamnophis elegans TaxID=35005 RepID=UPI0013787363|nr:ohanin-like [Thamnophis elegans]
MNFGYSQQNFKIQKKMTLELECITVMSPSAGFQFSLNFLQAKKVLRKLTGLCCMLLFTLCFFADQENGGKAQASPPGKWKKADVTFDSNTAFESLVVSPDKKTVKNVGVPQGVPDNPERFNSSSCVLGSPGFRSGKHFFVVEFGRQREWAVGLAAKSVKRKGYLTLVPEERIWQKGLWWLRRRGTDSDKPHNSSGKIIVFLDYNMGKVIFNLTGEVTTIKASFNREEVLPFFYLGGGVSLKNL